MNNRIRKFLPACVVVVGSLTLAAIPGAAQTDIFASPPDRGPNSGLFPGGAFPPSSVESVDATTGNLSLSIPLASLPPGPAGFTAGVNLTYNSTLFDISFDPVTTPGHVHANYQPSTHGGGWGYNYQYTLWSQKRADVPNGDLCPSPNPLTAAEQAWFKTYFTTPDGRNHLLRLVGVLNTDGSVVNTLGTAYTANTSESYYSVDFAGNQSHWCSTASGNFNGILVYATVDSTYIRVEAQTWAHTWFAYFPDGTRVQGLIVTDPTTSQATDSAADLITDRNGNTETITGNCAVGTACTVTLTDAQLRNVEIQYASDSGQTNWSDTISSPGVNGPLTTTVNWETYNFNQSLQYPCTAPWFLVGLLYTCTEPSSTPVISSVQLPPASSGGPSSTFTFDYTAPQGQISWGEIHTMTMNSGTQAEYFVHYGYYFDPAGSQRPYGNVVNPITSRALSYEEIRDDAINTPLLLTETTNYAIPLPPTTSGTAINLISTIMAPDGSSTQVDFANLCPSGVSSSAWTDFCSPLVYKVVAADGSTAETSWASNTAPPGVPSGGFANPFAQYAIETHTLSPSGTAIRGVAASQDQNGNPMVSSEYDWFSSAPSHNTNNLAGVSVVSGISGSPLRTTTALPYSQSAYWSTRAPNYPEAAFLRSIQCVTTGAPAPLLNCSSVPTGVPAGNAVSQFTYDSFSATGNLTQLQQLDSTTGSYISTSWTYLTNGNLAKTKDANANITQISYDTLNLCPLQTVVSGMRTTTYSPHRYTYNNASNSSDPNNGHSMTTCALESQTDADNSITTAYTYDGLGRQLTATQTGRAGLSRTTTTTYNDVGLSVTTTQQQSTPSQTLTSSTNYDALGRVRLTIDPAGNKVQMAYRFASGSPGGSYQLTSNSYSSNTSNSDPAMGWTLATSDKMGRPITVQSYGQDNSGDSPPVPWGSATNLTGQATGAYNQSVSGCSGPATKLTDEALNTRTNCTDGLGRLVALTEPNGNVTGYVYDLLDNLTAVNVPGQTRSFTYSTLSRQTSATNPEQNSPSNPSLPGVISYLYDSNGNLKQQTDARGTIALYDAYDGLNRISGITYTPAGSTAATPPVTYQYDQDFKGALSSVTAGNNSTSYTHDGFGRIASSTQTTAGAAYPAFQYAQYSLTDDPTQVTYPSGRVVNYTLDTGGRVGGVKGTTAAGITQYASGITYNAASAPLTIPFNNGVTETHSWNDRLQHTGVSAGSLLSLKFYPCDAGQTQCASNNNGKIWRQDISVGGSLQASEEYRYDQLNRLYAAGERASTVFNPSCSDSSAVWSQQFNYDAAGNRTVSCQGGNAAGLSGGVNSVNPATNRILDSGWGYDAAGNIVTTPSATSTPQTIAYDAENRQVAFCTQDPSGCVNQAGTGRTLYVYDGDGQRVQKVTAAGTVTYVYDAFGNMAAEYGGAPNANGTQYVTGDHLTSTRLVMPGTASQVALGTGIERHDYYPFGFETSGGWRTSGLGYGPDTVRQKFTGQERDVESTLDFFQARYYSGPQGRFMSVDPGNAGASLGDPQSWNGYSYVSNGPMMYADPDGLGIFGDIGSVIGSFFPGLGTLIGWGIGSIADLATGQSISPPGLIGVGSDIIGGIAGGGNGGVFGGGAGGPFVFNATVISPNVNVFSNAPVANLAGSIDPSGLDLNAQIRLRVLAGNLNGIARYDQGIIIGPPATAVYRGVSALGETIYVGITRALARRAAQHAGRFAIEGLEGLKNLSPADARAVEQTLIEYYKLGKNGGELLNRINSIARSNPIYSQALQRGTAILRSIGFPGF